MPLAVGNGRLQKRHSGRPSLMIECFPKKVTGKAIKHRVVEDDDKT
jgi:hypothetical protein